MNRPGHHNYKPTKPWVYKERNDGSIARHVHICVNNLRTAGKSEKECWMVSQRVSSVLASLGIQGATHKRCLPDLDAGGAWKGLAIDMSNNKITCGVANLQEADQVESNLVALQAMSLGSSARDQKMLLEGKISRSCALHSQAEAEVWTGIGEVGGAAGTNL